MALNKSLFLSAALLLGTMTAVHSQTVDVNDRKYQTIGDIEVVEIETPNIKSFDPGFNSFQPNGSFGNFDGFNNMANAADPIERTGRVISIGRELVALGEDIYRLVIKGKPTNTTTYAPLSIIPKVAGAPVDIFDTEGWRMPIKKSYNVRFKNLYRMTVVNFTYAIVYSYGGSYDGKGAYITGAQIIPEKVDTLFGFEFNATMKLAGISNTGTKANPVAAATLLLEYNVNSIAKASTNTDTFYITGKGALKRYK